MPKKDFFFHYDIKTKTGGMKLDDKYIQLDIKKSLKTTSYGVIPSSSSGLGYGLNLIWEDKK